MEYTEATFNKVRKFLDYSYCNPHKKYDDLMEFLAPILRKNENDDSVKPHDPKEDITSALSPEIYDYNESFLRNPNPYRSIIFKWEKLNENPFHCFWKYCSVSDKNKEIYRTILREDLQDSYFTIEDFGEKASENAGVVDNSLAGKELRKTARQGIMKTLYVKKINKDFHILKLIDASFEKEKKQFGSLISDFSKTGPCSAIGSFILDRFYDEFKEEKNPVKSWVKKFLVSSLDSQIMYDIFDAITDRTQITIKKYYESYGRARTEDLRVYPLFIVRSLRTGRFVLVYKDIRNFGICDVSRILEVRKWKNVFDQYDEARKAAEQLFALIWDFPEDVTFCAENAQLINIEIKGELTKEDRERFRPLNILSEGSGFRVYGKIIDLTKVLPEIFKYLGRITKIKVSPPLKKQTGLSLFQEVMYFSFRDIFWVYGIGLEMEYMYSKGDYSFGDEMLREPPGRFWVSDNITPYAVEEKTFEEDSSLHNYFYSKDFIEYAKDEGAEMPITAPELRWLYSVLTYENENSGVQSEFMMWLHDEAPNKLFTQESFKSIRKSHCFDSYEKIEGKEICVLSLSDKRDMNCSELYNLFPETRNNLKKNNKVEVLFHYELEDEDKIIPFILSLGGAVKVTSPERMVNKIKRKLEDQKKLFASWKGLDVPKSEKSMSV